MGDVAGSGGYYVACVADTIFADATTLTGSIGVLGGKLATTEMWRKVGITFKEYKRGQNAGIFSTDEVFTESERARVRALLDEVYAGFKKHVTDIRGQRLKKPIEELAGGRVYTGKQALELGLVDRLGTLSDAVAFAADQAKLKTYDVRVVPEPKSFLERLTERASGGKDEPGHVASAGGQNALFKLADSPFAEPGSAAHRGHCLGSEPAGDSATRGRSADDARARCSRNEVPENPRRPPATLWQPFGLTEPECPNSKPSTCPGFCNRTERIAGCTDSPMRDGNMTISLTPFRAGGGGAAGRD